MNYKYLLILVSFLFVCCNTYDNKINNKTILLRTVEKNNIKNYNLINYYLNTICYHVSNNIWFYARHYYGMFIYKLTLECIKHIIIVIIAIII